MAKKQSGLGRDFYSLFDDNMVGESKKSAAEMLRIADVEPRADQPRKVFEREALEQLEEVGLVASDVGKNPETDGVAAPQPSSLSQAS